MSSIKRNPDEVHIFAILYPAKGKYARVKELMKYHIEETHKNEDYTVKYLMTEEIDKEEGPLHMIETSVITLAYLGTNRKGAEDHTKTANFKVLMDAAEKENLWEKPPYLVFTKTTGGFDWDREKV